MMRSWLRLCRPVLPEGRRSRLTLEHLEERTLLDAVPFDPFPYSDSHILVRFSNADHPTVLPGTRLGTALDLVPGLYVVELSAGLSVNDALTAYRSNSGVISAEPDYQLGTSWTPNDSRLPEQWGMRNTGQQGGTVGGDINAPGAWGVTTGNWRTVVGVMDSGIDYTHPDLYLNIWLNQGEIPPTRRNNLIDVDRDGLITFWDLNDTRNQGTGKITDLNNNGYIDGGDLLRPMIKNSLGQDTGKGGWADGISNEGDRWVDDLVGWNSNANTNDPKDGYGHGTHIAGTIGAIGNNRLGVAGVNWKVQLAGVKFFNDQGFGSVSQFIDGLEWALAKGIRLSNNSWVDSGYTPALFEAVKRARDQGHIFVAAAGNNGRNTDITPVYPAGFDLDNIVSVGAIDRTGMLASFSNFGVNSVDIVAPGVSILSTNPGNSYGMRSGTSMATPHVTGVIALVWSLRPEWSYGQVIYWVMQTANRLPSLTGKVASGLLNAALAVRVPPRGTVVPSRSTTSSASSASVAALSQPTATQTIDEVFCSMSLQMRSKKDKPAADW